MNSIYFLTRVLLFAIFLSISLSFAVAHKRYQQCPAHCVCSCPQSSNHKNFAPPPPPNAAKTPSPPKSISSPPKAVETPPPKAAKTSPPPPNAVKTPSPPPPKSTSPPPNVAKASPPPPPKAVKTPSPPPTAVVKTSPPPPSQQNDNQNSSNFTGCFSKVFAFGDSYTDTGNAALLEGLKSFVGFLLPYSPYATSMQGQRLSNGRLVIDFLCESLNLPLLPAYKQNTANFSFGCNFAIAGSTSLTTDFFKSNKFSHTLMWKVVPESFQTQIDWFNKFISAVDCKGKSDADCKSDMENTLFWIGELGRNDYTRVFGSHVKVQWLTEVVVNHVCKILKTLLDKGAKYIVVQGLPPAGCCPVDLALHPNDDRDNMGCSQSANAMIIAHNELLQKRLAELRLQYGDCHITYADTWNAYQTILANPKQFGFEESFKACCGVGGGPFNFDLQSLCGADGTSTCKNPDKYINWDGIHMTEAMNKHLAKMFFHGGYCKPSFVEMVKAKKAHKF